MSVLFKGRRSSLPNAEGQKLYYVQLVNNGNIGMDEIAAKIKLKSSLTQGDVLSVIRNLLQIMQDAFKDGKSVKLDGLGSFFLVARSNGNGVATKDEVSSNQIKRVQIHFREETTRTNGQTRNKLSDEIHFVHADTMLEALAKDGVKDGNVDGGGGNDGGNDDGGQGGGEGGGGDDLLG